MARRALLFALLFAVCFIPFSTYEEDVKAPTRYWCIGEERPPLLVDFSVPESSVSPGAALPIQGSITAEADGFLVLRFEAEAGARLQSPSEQVIGQVNFGQTIPFSIDASILDAERAAVHVTAEMQNPDGTVRFAERKSMYAVMRDGQSWVGNGGFLALESRSIQERSARGLLAVDEAAALRAELATVEHITHEVTEQPRSFTPRDQELNQLVGAPSGGYRGIERAPTADITIQGNVQWTDENGNTHPMYGATVSIRDDDGILPVEIITAVVTDVNGDYMAVVNDNDGIGQGDRDIFVVVRAANGWVDTQNTSGDTYVMVGPTYDETPGGSLIVENFTAPNNGAGDSFSVFQGGTWHAAYTEVVHGGALAQVDLVWPNGGDGSFFDGKVKMEQDDRFDWDTTGHEYGHYVQSQLNTSANPGGAHSSANCATDVRPTKDEGLRLAWGESWPTFFCISGQMELNLASLNVPRVGNDIYEDVEDGSVVYSMETMDSLVGEGTERAIMHILWDLWDGPADNRDNISLSDTDIWTTIDAADPDRFDQAWTALRSGRTTAVDLLMGELATDEGMSSALQSPADGGIISPSNNSMSWTRGVGCSTVNDGDDFDLIFYDANTLATILTIPNLTSPSHNLTNGQIATIVGVTHDVLWGVEASNTDSPATGPYHSETFAATVNRPPVADAGPDQTVECESHTTTAVQLDGTGSSDPDGDALTYSWTGADFDNPNSATPTGQFAQGTTEVTLEVSDGIQTDTDMVQITVEDTTPPVVTCPDSITVECTSHDGTPKDHPSLIPFFSSAEIEDICDDNPTLVNDAPDFFTLGATEVWFVGTDADGNADSCSAWVTVEDTTPPEITVELDRDVLWPPNHKMVDIVASVMVEDICDPNPTFVLTSVTVDESDNANGVGDGNTNGDVDAAIGTADTTLALRSERQGRGDGRKYTIIYTAMDMSNNSASDTVCVTVPHSSPGNGLLAATGNGSAPIVGQGFTVLIEDRDGVVADTQKILLGNTHGTVTPESVIPVAGSKSGLTGYLARFSGDGVNAILAASGVKDALGLSYRAEAGDGLEYFLIKEIDYLPLFDVASLKPAEEEEPLDIALQPEGEEVEPEASPAIRYGTVEIFSVTGRQVRVVRDVNLDRIEEFTWDGRTESGSMASNGVYFYRVSGIKDFQPKKVVVVR